MDERPLRQLQKLRITRQQWRIIFKWALYALAFIATVVIQGVILNRHGLLGVKVNLIPYFVGCVCIIEGADAGSVFALIVSLAWALSGGDLGFVSILVLTLGGMALGIAMDNLLRDHIGTCIACCFVLCLVHESAIFLLRLFLHTVTARQYFRILVPGVLLGILSCPAFYYLFRLIHRVGGGRTWNA